MAGIWSMSAAGWMCGWLYFFTHSLSFPCLYLSAIPASLSSSEVFSEGNPGSAAQATFKTYLPPVNPKEVFTLAKVMSHCGVTSMFTF